MQSVIDQLKQNLQLIYRRGLDADAKLTALQQQGKGKFQSVFADDAGFTVSSKRFGPYIEELGKEILALEQAEDDARRQAMLPDVVKKMQLMLTTLGQFRSSL